MTLFSFKKWPRFFQVQALIGLGPLLAILSLCIAFVSLNFENIFMTAALFFSFIATWIWRTKGFFLALLFFAALISLPHFGITGPMPLWKLGLAISLLGSLFVFSVALKESKELIDGLAQDLDEQKKSQIHLNHLLKEAQKFAVSEKEEIERKIAAEEKKVTESLEQVEAYRKLVDVSYEEQKNREEVQLQLEKEVESLRDENIKLRETVRSEGQKISSLGESEKLYIDLRKAYEKNLTDLEETRTKLLQKEGELRDIFDEKSGLEQIIENLQKNPSNWEEN